MPGGSGNANRRCGVEFHRGSRRTRPALSEPSRRTEILTVVPFGPFQQFGHFADVMLSVGLPSTETMMSPGRSRPGTRERPQTARSR